MKALFLLVSCCCLAAGAENAPSREPQPPATKLERALRSTNVLLKKEFEKVGKAGFLLEEMGVK